MPLNPNDRYAEISKDWRHRDNLTWQLPTVLFAFTIAIYAGVIRIAESNNLCVFLLPVLYFIGCIVSLAFVIMLGQNLWYQLGSTFFLKRIEINENPTSTRHLKG